LLAPVRSILPPLPQSSVRHEFGAGCSMIERPGPVHSCSFHRTPSAKYVLNREVEDMPQMQFPRRVRCWDDRAVNLSHMRSFLSNAAMQLVNQSSFSSCNQLVYRGNMLA